MKQSPTPLKPRYASIRHTYALGFTVVVVSVIFGVPAAGVTAESFLPGARQDPHGRAHGPLRVHPGNPRYLADDDRRAIYLTGSHTWLNLQDGDTVLPASPFDYDGYLDLLVQNNHNFIRLWTWESPAWIRPDSTTI